MDINIKVNKATRDAIPDKNKIGVEGENLQEKLVFYFEDEFVDGVARLEYEQDSVKNYIPLTKIDQTYVVPIKNVITKPWKLNLQLVITENEQSEGIPLFKSDMFEVYITNSINAVGEAPEGYDLWIDIANAKLLLMDEKIDEANDAIENISTAIQETENLDLDVNKIEKETTVEITKKDGTTKSVKIYDGVSLQFMWQGTSLGIKTDDMEEYIFVNLQGIQGVPGPQGEPFRIKKTYSSVAEMYADFDNMNVGDYVMIATSVEIEDNAKLYTKGDLQWIFITDFSGAMGIKGETGATPIIHIGTVTSGDEPSVTISGTAENPIFNFVLKPGPQGQTGATGETGATGNGIASIIKTGTDGLVDTYTITFTNGNTSTFTVTNGEDGEVTQTQLDETNAEVERAMMVYNALPKVEDEGTEITLDGTANCPMKLELNPSELTQETTTGANLQKFNVRTSGTSYSYKCDENGQVTITGSVSTNTGLSYNLNTNYMSLAAGTYKMKIIGQANNITLQTNNAKAILGTFDNNKEATLMVTDDITDFQIYQYPTIDAALNENYYITLASGTTATTERYTGGIPQPNPDYPSEVQVIKGNNSIKIENKNLFDKTGTFTKPLDYWVLPVKLKNNTTYSLSAILKETKLTNVVFGIAPSGNKYSDFADTMKILIGYGTGDINNVTFTTNSEWIDPKFVVYASNSTVLNSIFDNYNIQLEQNLTPTTYVAHQEQVLPLNLPVENLLNNATFVKGRLDAGVVGYASGTTSIETTETGIKVITNQNYRGATSDWISVKSSTKYIVSNNSNNTIWVAQFDANKDYISQNSGDPTPYSFTTSSTTKYVRIGYILGVAGTYDIKDIQLQEGTKVNTYTPYGTTPIEYCKIGDYEDEFEHDGDKWYFNKNIGKVVLDGSETWYQAGNNDNYTRFYFVLTSMKSLAVSVCNKFYAKNVITASTQEECFSSTTNANYLYFMLSNIRIGGTTITDLTTWLSNNNVTVYYQLSTPTHTEITDTTLISQLNAIEKAVSYDGQTNISQTNTGLPFRIKASAVRSLANIFDLINE